MALDQPPMNRAARRAAAHKKGSKVAPLVRAARQSHQSQSRSAAPDQATGTGDPLESDDMADEAPAASSPFASMFGGGAADEAPTSRARKPSHHRGGSKQQRVWEGLVSYYGFAGMLVMSRNQADGLLIVSRAEKLADAWIDAGKASPEIMRVLEVLTVAGPYTALVMVHAKLAMDLMSNHGTSPLSLFARPKQDGAVPSDGHVPGAAPATPYQPVGPFAPTDTTPPPFPPTDEGLKVWPDVGIPADLDVALRQAARESGRPYSELRDQAMLELAQMQMSQNGHVVAPGALGAPVARE